MNYLKATYTFHVLLLISLIWLLFGENTMKTINEIKEDQ